MTQLWISSGLRAHIKSKHGLTPKFRGARVFDGDADMMAHTTKRGLPWRYHVKGRADKLDLYEVEDTQAPSLRVWIMKSGGRYLEGDGT